MRQEMLAFYKTNTQEVGFEKWGGHVKHNLLE